MPWEKGESGNPKGRTKNEDAAATAIRRALSDRDWDHMAKSLLSVLVIPDEIQGYIPNPNTNGREKAAAYNALADRAFGKPVQKQEIKTEITAPIDPEELEKLRKNILGEHDE